MSSTTITTTPKRKAFRKLKWSSRKKARTSPFTRPRLQQMNRMIVPVGRGPVPQQTIISLKYNYSWTSLLATMDNRFNLNSIFEPRYGESNHQPLGRDQYATFYNRYRVLKARVRIITTCTLSTSFSSKLIVVADNSTNLYTESNLMIEQRGAREYVSRGDSKGPIVFEKTFYPNQITGVSKKAYEDDRFQALMTATPTENIILHVAPLDVFNNKLADGSFQNSITIEYTVSMFDPVPLAAS